MIYFPNEDGKKEQFANSKWILLAFRSPYGLLSRSNLSNDDIISKRPGLKTGVENDIFCWCEIGSGLESRAVHPHQEFPGVSPGIKSPLFNGLLHDYFRCSRSVVIVSCFSPTSTCCSFYNVHGSRLKMPCGAKWRIGEFFVFRKLIFAITTNWFFFVGINFCDLQKVADESFIIFWFSLPGACAMVKQY